jgi:hypothetical protein
MPTQVGTALIGKSLVIHVRIRARTLRVSPADCILRLVSHPMPNRSRFNINDCQNNTRAIIPRDSRRARCRRRVRLSMARKVQPPQRSGVAVDSSVSLIGFQLKAAVSSASESLRAVNLFKQSSLCKSTVERSVPSSHRSAPWFEGGVTAVGYFGRGQLAGA